jgi:16S rRNA (adenine1518-N6/adenine1519-N6)-dimethyltransferase
LPGIVSGPDAEKDHRKDGHGASKPYKIVGNIPYYITGKLLRVISELDQKPVRAVLMVQKEVAERICAVSPEMNRLAASVQFWADARIIAIVPKKDFSPPPEVDSAVIVLETKKWALDGTPAHGSAAHIDPELYYRAVRGIFAQPRKTLLNNIMAIDNALNEKNDKNGPDDKPKMSHGKEVVAARLMECGIDPAARPQDLDIAQITLIANTLLGEIWG